MSEANTDNLVRSYGTIGYIQYAHCMKSIIKANLF